MSVGDRETRRDRSENLRRRLAAMSDLEVVELVIEGEVLGAGIGGTRSLVVLDDIPLFVKRVPLTDLRASPGQCGFDSQSVRPAIGLQLRRWVTIVWGLAGSGRQLDDDQLGRLGFLRVLPDASSLAGAHDPSV